jgi:hypothetical protein
MAEVHAGRDLLPPGTRARAPRRDESGARRDAAGSRRGEGPALAGLGGEDAGAAARDPHPPKEGRGSRGAVRSGAEGPVRNRPLAARELQPSDEGPGDQDRAGRDGSRGALVVVLDRGAQAFATPGLRKRQVGEGDLERERRGRGRKRAPCIRRGGARGQDGPRAQARQEVERARRLDGRGTGRRGAARRKRSACAGVGAVAGGGASEARGSRGLSRRPAPRGGAPQDHFRDPGPAGKAERPRGGARLAAGLGRDLRRADLPRGRRAGPVDALRGPRRPGGGPFAAHPAVAAFGAAGVSLARRTHPLREPGRVAGALSRDHRRAADGRVLGIARAPQGALRAGRPGGGGGAHRRLRRGGAGPPPRARPSRGPRGAPARDRPGGAPDEVPGAARSRPRVPLRDRRGGGGAP